MRLGVMIGAERGDSARKVSRMLADIEWAENAGMDTAFDAIMSADELNIFKPSPQLYRLACTRLKVGTGELGFVSSNSWDVSGAASTGLTTFWVQRSAGEPADRLGFSATYVIASLDHLAGLFG